MHQDDNQRDDDINQDPLSLDGDSADSNGRICTPLRKSTDCRCVAFSAPTAPRALSWQCAARPWAGFLTRHLPG